MRKINAGQILRRGLKVCDYLHTRRRLKCEAQLYSLINSKLEAALPQRHGQGRGLREAANFSE